MQSNKPILIFLLKFFVSYVILVGLYSYYLKATQTKETAFSCAPITQNVANQTAKVISFLGYNVTVEQHQEELSLKMFIDNTYVSRVIEGCNSVSIIILFLAFIIAFSGAVKTTIWFGILGSILIYAINIVRIAILSIGILKYPEYQDVLHSLVFPAIIYGLVFLLWIIWVNKFSHFIRQKK